MDKLIHSGTKQATQKEVQIEGTLQVRLLNIDDTFAWLQFELVGKNGNIACRYERTQLKVEETMRIDLPVTETVIIREFLE